MAPASRGMPSRSKPDRLPRKQKGGTASLSNHRFESFSQRIARLKIDPVRRVRQLHDGDAVRSYLGSSLAEWNDMNLSENFVTFSEQIQPLCQSLPQILHHQDEIFKLLIDYLQKRDAFSLEPLLSLTAHLAHDLGARFEKFFPKAVETIRDIASSHQDVEVIEWSFNCIAWLFKYLSRLLAPDLGPLYGLMSPLLGRSRQKYFVTRFAGEAMSFLVRKAASQSNKTSEPTRIFLSAAMSDLASCPVEQKDELLSGLIHLNAEVIKGVQRGVSTMAPAYLQALLNFSLDATQFRHDMISLIEGTLITILHQTNSEGFSPLLEVILHHDFEFSSTEHLEMALRILYVIIGTRKGTRVSSWPSIFKKSLQAIEAVASRENPPADLKSSAVQLTSVLLQYCPSEIMAPRASKVTKLFEKKPLDQVFLQLCFLCAEIGKARFDTYLLPQLQTFITDSWSNHGDRVGEYIPLFASKDYLDASILSIPHTWQEDILQSFEQLLKQLSDQQHDFSGHILLEQCNRYLRLLEACQFSEETRSRFTETLRQLIKGQLPVSRTSIQARFVLGPCFNTLMNITVDADMGNTLPVDQLLDAASIMSRSTPYMRAMCKQLSRDKDDATTSESVEVFVQSVVSNLASRSHDLRTFSLDAILNLLPSSESAARDIISTAIAIETSPHTVECARAMAMRIRNLARDYSPISKDHVIFRAIPAYLFGVLHIKLAPLWDEASTALEAVCISKQEEDNVISRAVDWLNIDPRMAVHARESTHAKKNDKIVAREHECSNLMHIDQQVEWVSGFETSIGVGEDLKVDRAVRLEPRVDETNRPQALRVLKKLAHVAERRSRSLVPIVLEWISDDQDEDEAEPEEPDSENDTLTSEELVQHPQKSKWTRRDRIALLEVFSNFNNPSVLYKANELYTGLLSLLCSGDADVQKAALRAIFTWKKPGVRPYEENLLKLLDDMTFRDELTTFLNVDIEDSQIQLDHRADLQPVLLRILYGRTVARGRSANSMRGQDSRRKAVLLALSRYGRSELQNFISVALGPLNDLGLFTDEGLQTSKLALDLLPARRRLGAIRMIRETLESLATETVAFADNLLHAMLYCIFRASGKLHDGNDSTIAAVDENTHSDLSLLKSIRQEGLQCLAVFTNAFPLFDWGVYSPSIHQFLVAPRVEKLSTEMLQGISGLFKLFASWAADPNTVQAFLHANPDVLKQLSDSIIQPSGKDEVRAFVLNNILCKYVENAQRMNQEKEAGASISQESIPSEFLSHLLSNVSVLVHMSPSKACIEAAIQTITMISPLILSVEDVKVLVEVSMLLLKSPTATVSPRLKGQVMEILQLVISQHEVEPSDKVYDPLIELLSSLFGYFKDAPNRLKVVHVFEHVTRRDNRFDGISRICAGLNAMSSRRATEPDFDVRLDAFNKISDEASQGWQPLQWMPILHNLLFLIHDDEELAMRTSASIGLKNFVRAACNDGESRNVHRGLMQDLFIPAVQKGLRENSELVRAEFVSLLSELTKYEWQGFQDMTVLLGPDDESSFLNNILHIQQHRRSRALRRLIGDAPSISSGNLWRFCIPLIENFLSGDEDNEHSLASDAINTLGQVAIHLEWQSYRTLLIRKVDDAGKFDSKLRIRVLASVAESLHRASTLRRITEVNSSTSDEMEVDKETQAVFRLVKSLPDSVGVSSAISTRVLKKLMECIHFRDESTIELRVMAASIAVKLILCLSEDEVSAELPVVMTDVSNVLKSRAQEARDIARKTLSDIASMVGPRYLGFLLKQMRRALQRGAHLHVLGFTVHTVMVAIAPTLSGGQIDYCAADIMAVIVDDLFGSAGQEKEAEEYVSKMKEVRSKNHSYDTLELLSSLIMIEQLPTLLTPLQEQLRKPKPRTEKIDELFARLREGLRKNELINDQKALVICFQLIQKQYDRLRGGGKLGEISSIKTVAFATDLLRRIIDKHENLKTPYALLGFMPLIEETMKQSESELRIAAMRLLISIIKVPMPVLDEKAPSYIRQAKQILEVEPSTSSPLSQAALRLSAAVLRDRPYAVIKQSFFEHNVAFMIKRIQPDLQETGKQGEKERQVAALNFLRAVVGRNVMFPEVYDVMDVVREIMITSGEDPVPNLARSIFSRFILDYFPDEGKGLSKQTDFLVKNLQYPNARGRQSIMDVMMFLLGKKDDASVQVTLVTFFLPLMLVLAVDRDSQCRQAAALLLQKVFERADSDRLSTFKKQMYKWIDEDTEVEWQRTGLLCWREFFDAQQSADKDAREVMAACATIIESGSSTTKGANAQLLDAALETAIRLSDLYPSVAFTSSSQKAWTNLSEVSLSNRSAVALNALKLLNAYFVEFARHASREGVVPASIPLVGQDGLHFTSEDARLIIDSHTQLLKKSKQEESLTSAVVKNLAFICRVASSGNAQELVNSVLDSISSVIRHEESDASLKPKTAALQLLETLCNSLSAEALEPTLHAVLLALVNMTDKAVTHSTRMPGDHAGPTQDDISAKSQEILSILQAKTGAQDFVAKMQKVQTEVRERREERRAKRKIEAINDPEKANRDKARRHERSKVRRREKNAEHAGRRRGW